MRAFYAEGFRGKTWSNFHFRQLLKASILLDVHIAVAQLKVLLHPSLSVYIFKRNFLLSTNSWDKRIFTLLNSYVKHMQRLNKSKNLLFKHKLMFIIIINLITLFWIFIALKRTNEKKLFAKFALQFITSFSVQNFPVVLSAQSNSFSLLFQEKSLYRLGETLRNLHKEIESFWGIWKFFVVLAEFLTASKLMQFVWF